MDRAQAAIIRTTYTSLEPRLDALADRFFLRLLAAHPRARRVLPPEPVKQKKYVIDAVRLIATEVDSFARLEPRLAAMGLRHARYGATAEHYTAVRGALIDALRDLCGSSWTPMVESAWTLALEAATGIMLRTAHRARAEAA